MKTKLILCFIAITQISVKAIDEPSIDLLAPFTSPIDSRSQSRSNFVNPNSISSINPYSSGLSNQFIKPQPVVQPTIPSYRAPASSLSSSSSTFQNKYPSNQYRGTQTSSSPSYRTSSPSVSSAPIFKPYQTNAGSVGRNSNEFYAKTISYKNELYPNGYYEYAYNTDNGISVDEKGEPKYLGGNPPQQAEHVIGGYSYTAPNGEQISLRYVADENGFHPEGAHLPTAPPIPFAIQRSIDYIRAKQARN